MGESGSADGSVNYKTYAKPWVLRAIGVSVFAAMTNGLMVSITPELIIVTPLVGVLALGLVGYDLFKYINELIGAHMSQMNPKQRESETDETQETAG